MEFNEKLQELRKSKDLTQEELAEKLYVSRTAVSKWESGRGYPNIDSLKEISMFFSVSIDELLSSEKLLFIAEKENKTNIKNICELLFGAVDLFYILLIFLPLYPDTVNGFIYSVSLLNYTEISEFNKIIYFISFFALIILGILKLIFTKVKKERFNNILTVASVVLNILIVLLFAITREVYALILVFIFLITKSLLILKYIKAS
ncbi:MAG: helix-turn-helix transcriptional regulator [Clostridia bacterium]|jgi:transcriptional regulator with XRE-family HTH domain|nr:helix-turn-helix transcriptional regulator [Clostridia bacterium]